MDPVTPDAPEAPVSETPLPGGAPEASPELDFDGADPFAPIEGEPDPSPEWKDHVHKLRQQGGAYRLKAKEFKDQVDALAPLAGMFEGWEAEQVEGWKTFLGSAQENPEGALAALLQEGFGLDRDAAAAALESIYGDGAETPPAPGDPNDPDRPMTRAEYDAERSREAEESEVSKQLDLIHDEAKQLGYSLDAKPGSREEGQLQRLLHLAATTTDGDLSKAHDALVAEEQEIVKRHLDSLAETADGLPSVTGNGGPGAPAGDRPKTWADAQKRSDEWLRSSANA